MRHRLFSSITFDGRIRARTDRRSGPHFRKERFLLVPFEWEGFEQLGHVQLLALSAGQDRFRDLWREQCEANDAAEIGLVDLFCFCEIAHTRE